MAAVTFYVGFVHFMLYGRRRNHPEDLSFALMCLTMAFYDAFSAGAYAATTLSDGFQWQKAQVAALSMIGATYTWFATDYARWKSKVVRNVSGLFFTVSAGLVLFVNGDLFWHIAEPAVKRMYLFGGSGITYFEVTPGFYTEFLGLMGFLVFVYVFYLVAVMVRKDRSRSLPLFLSALTFCAGLVNDALVHDRIIRNFYVIEYAYMAIVIFMAHTLSNDVVESASLKEAFEASERKYRSLVDNSLVGIFIAQRGHIRFCNQQFARIFDCADETAALLSPVETFMPSDDETEPHHWIYEDFELPQRFERKGRTLSGRVIDLEVLTTPIVFETRPAVQGSVINITVRKTAEALLQKNLSEKNILLKEIHHRVKNNLQIIISLLNLSAARLTDSEIQRVLEDSNQRIRTMAMIHERLYQSEDFERIDFREYTETLVSELIASHQSGNRINPRFDLGVGVLSLDLAIPCGLILNELVTNSVKHAFPGSRTGSITVRFEEREDGKYALEVADDGIGMPRIPDLDGMESLGMKLVDVLTQQLDGRLAFRIEGGLTVTVTFPKPENLET
jgi:PAS domain S-box-containing protein